MRVNFPLYSVFPSPASHDNMDRCRYAENANCIQDIDLFLHVSTMGEASTDPECHETGEIGDSVGDVRVRCEVKGENPIEGLSSHRPPVELLRSDLFFEESQRA